MEPVPASSFRRGGWGVDAPLERRPGVPRLKSPPARLPGARRDLQPQAEPARKPTHRVEIARLPPVFGTAQLPRGVSGVLRRRAYAKPEHLARHWLLLLVADRVEVAGHRLAALAKRTAVGGAIVLAGVLVDRWLRDILGPP